MSSLLEHYRGAKEEDKVTAYLLTIALLLGHPLWVPERAKRSLANAEKHHRLGIVKVNFPSPLGSSVL